MGGAESGPARPCRDGLGGPERRHAPGAGLLGGRVEVPSLPPFPSRPPPRSLEEAASARVFGIAERSLFLPLALFRDLRSPNPRAHPPRTPLSVFLGFLSDLPVPRVSAPHFSVPNPGKHAPFPLFLESAPPNPRLSRLPSQRTLPLPPGPRSAIWPQRGPLPPGRERAEASSVPAPRPPPLGPLPVRVLASRTAAPSCFGL